MSQLFPPDVLEPEKERNHSMAVMTSSEDMTWATPQEWFDYLNLEFKFNLDPCCVAATAKCDLFYTPETDGLKQSWAGRRVFMNPPYGEAIYNWMKKAYEEARNNGTLVVYFVPARVDTQWWHDYAAKASDIRFPIGRVKFAGAETGAPFPVAIVIFRPRVNDSPFTYRCRKREIMTKREWCAMPFYLLAELCATFGQLADFYLVKLARKVEGPNTTPLDMNARSRNADQA